MISLRPFAALVSLVLLASCGDEEAPPAPPPPEVEIATIRYQEVTDIVDLPGRVEAIRTADVRARVNGLVQRRLYQEGSDVKAGQPLFQIDQREMQAAYAAASAALQRARATAANAQQDVKRYRTLVGEEAISEQEFDAAEARLRQAQADVAQAEAQQRSAALNLEYATVEAPISGRAGRALVTEGALVSASAGTLMTRIEQIHPIHVNFSQSNAELLALRRQISAGTLQAPDRNRFRVEIAFEDGTPYPMAGRVDFFDMAVDEGTGTVSLRAEFPNPQRLLLPGQFVRARVIVGISPRGIVVPQRAVHISPNRKTVMVVGENNVVAEQEVELGQMEGSGWVVTSGLKPGDRVIVSGLQKVQPGQPVRIAAAAPARTPRTSGSAPAAQAAQPAPAATAR